MYLKRNIHKIHKIHKIALYNSLLDMISNKNNDDIKIIKKTKKINKKKNHHNKKIKHNHNINNNTKTTTTTTILFEQENNRKNNNNKNLKKIDINKKRKIERITLKQISFKIQQNENDSNINQSVLYNPFKKIFEIKDLIKYLNRFVVGQEEAKIILSTLVHFHYSTTFNKDFDISKPKSIPIIMGPTGCGKTFILRKISDFLNVPFISIDATTLTPTGFIGDSINNIFPNLLKESKYNLEKAQTGIILIDEIDKLVIPQTSQR